MERWRERFQKLAREDSDKMDERNYKHWGKY